MLDEVIRGGTVIDGTGAPGRVADVGIRDGRIVAIGTIDEEAAREIDATGLVVAPGFVDPHTHYDAQLMWDPTASPSSMHGVTTVIGGNCGFTLAPLRDGDADYLRRMMAKVEGMPLPALEHGTDWEWETFAQFLDRFEGGISVNAGFLVGHCAIRRYVMGTDAIGDEASPEQIAEMRAELGLALESGALGFSFTQSSSHSDGDGQPVASRWATPEELVAMAEETGAHDGTTLEGIVQGCLDQFSDDEIELLGTLSAAADRPLNWNVLTIDAREPDRVPRQLGAGDRAVELGGRLVALTMPVGVPMNMSFNTFCAIWLLPGWQEVMGLPVPERIERLSDPDTRVWLLERSLSQEAGVFRRLADWGDYRLGDVYSEENEPLRGRMVGEIAAERGKSNFGTLLDIVIADDLRTVLWPVPKDDDGASWELRRQVWNDPRALLGGSDAGRAPRPHVRRALHHEVPRRLPARPSAGVARTGGAAHHERARSALRPPRPRCAPGRRDRRRRGVRPCDRGLRGGHARARPARRLRPPHRRLAGHRPGARQRHPDRRRGQGHRRHTRHGAALGPRHRNRHRTIDGGGA